MRTTLLPTFLVAAQVQAIKPHDHSQAICRVLYPHSLNTKLGKYV
jgi:hypothetical protein